MLYFFLSYARGDEDKLVQRFFDDLSVEVRLQAGLDPGTHVGFIDRTIEIGQTWPRMLTEALATCRCFLALITPRYFQSDPCGREWEAFAERMRQHRADLPLLKPLLWIPMAPSRMHPVARSMQYQSPTLGGLYADLGIRQLMRLRRHEDDYHQFIFDLAAQIVEHVHTHEIPNGASNIDYSTIRSAFALPAADPGGETLATKPLTIHFVVVSGSRDNMSEIRQDLHYYGDTAMEWAPYRPERATSLATSASVIAEGIRLTHRITGVSELTEQAELVSQHNQIVILLMDAWMSRSEAADRLLTDYNTRATMGLSPTTAVLIPRSRSDAETRSNWRTLSRACSTILYYLARDDELYREAIATHDEFEVNLPEVIEVARNRVYSTGHVMRDVGGEPASDLPAIEGPWRNHPSEEEP